MGPENQDSGDLLRGSGDAGVVERIAQVYEARGAVIVGSDRREACGPIVARVRPPELNDDEIALLAAATRDQAERGKALFLIRASYRTRVIGAKPGDVVEPRRRLVQDVRAGSIDFALEDDPTGLATARQRMVEALAGDIWFVPPDTCRLVEHAAESMPSWHLDAADLPAESGFAVFADPFEYPTAEPDLDVPYWVNAISWSLVEHDDELFVQFNDFEINAPDSGPWQTVSSGRHSWFVGDTVEDFGRLGVMPGNSIDAYRLQSATTRRRMACLWALAASPRLLTASDHPADRPTRRQDARAGVASHVVIFDLRRTERREGDRSSESNVEWSHRWVVTGHWRQQPFGPGARQRRPTWIAPHIKGPEDRPLVLKDRVAVVRPDHHETSGDA